MSDIYVARQPIFDRKMNLFGYELLYRENEKNMFPDTDDDRATASLLDDFALSDFLSLIDETRGFLNFSENLLVNQIPLMLPKENLVIEILERVEINDDVVSTCRDLMKKGYIFALDDFALDDLDKYASILDVIDIIKIEFSEEECTKHQKFINENKNRITFLAEKVETAQQYKEALKQGYSLFQGYFFSKPVMINSKAIGTLTNNLVLILNELNKPEPRYKFIASEFEKDVDLTYKLLRLVNSVYYGATNHIETILQSLVRLGTKELRRWVQLLMLKGIQNTENAELIKASLIRGKLLSLLAHKTNKKKLESDYFITGLFSSIDMLLDEDMADILERLSLSENVVDALLAKPTELRNALECTISFEKADWEKVDKMIELTGTSKRIFSSLYIKALKWQFAL